MVTTFFGAHSFGGDAAYVDRLTRALLRAGHEVHVAHCADAFEAVRGDHPLREFQPPEGAIVHRLESRFSLLSPLATQTTGQPYFKRKALKRILEDEAPDVIHFHNVSLIGGPGIFEFGERSIRLMTAHEHWLICPMHLLWKYNSKSCDKPECARCMVAGGRPPQLWRLGDAIPRGLNRLDALLFPSRHALEEHRKRGISAPLVHLPYFLPDGWPYASNSNDNGSASIPSFPAERPYFAAAGRLVKMKGFQQAIPLMRHLPEMDMRIAGTGPFEAELRALAEDLPNVKFEGLLGGPALARLFAGSRAVVVPSLFHETFGYVVLEAFASGVPVIVNRAGGALEETGVESGGGLGYSTDAELLLAMRRLAHDDALRAELAENGRRIRAGAWSETAHLDRYFELLGEIRHRKRGAGPHIAVSQPARSSDSSPSSAFPRFEATTQAEPHHGALTTTKSPLSF